MNIKLIQNTFKSSNNQNNVTYYIFYPCEVEIRGILQISHGMCEYFARYSHFARYLCSYGYIVCGNDHLGHGSTAMSDKDFGYFSRNGGDLCLIEDMYILTTVMKSRFGHDVPYFVLGHSMGSLITRLYLSKYGKEITGALLTGTLGANTLYPLVLSLIASNMKSKGPSYRSDFINNLIFGRFSKNFKNDDSKYNWLTRDEEVVALYENDAKCNFIFTLKGFQDLVNLAINANKRRTYEKTPKNIPILFLSGTLDPCGDFGKAVKSVFCSYKKYGHNKVDIKLYDDCRHEILNELCKKDVYSDILSFLEVQAM